MVPDGLLNFLLFRIRNPASNELFWLDRMKVLSVKKIVKIEDERKRQLFRHFDKYYFIKRLIKGSVYNCFLVST